MKRLRAALCVLAILAAAGCWENVPGPQTADLLESDLLREMEPAVDPSELGDLVHGNNEFACRLYQEVRGGEGNLVFSPYSISTAYAMVYAGARGETETQTADALRFPLPQDRLHPAFNYLDLDIASRTADRENPEDGRPRITVANSLWGQRGFPFLSSFLDVLAVNYGAGIRVVDFMANPETARLAINEWASDETEDLIRDLVPPGVVSPSTALVLANTTYFDSKWAYPFDPANTTDAPFTLLDGSEVTVPTMTLDIIAGYASGPGYEVVEIYFEGEEFSMAIVLPYEGYFDEFESSLTVETLEGIVFPSWPSYFWLHMPRFSCGSEIDLTEVLPALGMTDAFSPSAADFTGISPEGELWIGASSHKAKLLVDERGVVAASGTCVGVWVIGVPGTVTIDRPFIYFIRDRATGTILFLGRVVDPRG